jgi:uncharacterized peroxidase-related enzyme
MPHKTVREGFQGITGLMKAYPNTARYLKGLAEEILRGPSSLTPAEREIIATFVANGNDCYFSTSAHAATARHLLGSAAEHVDRVVDNFARAPTSNKLKALLAIADKVQESGRLVTEGDVARARKKGADDTAIHDTVLIAAAFCMFNRYVDGLDKWAPNDSGAYAAMGANLMTNRYVNSID